MGSDTPPENIACEHSLLCLLQMQVKALSCQEEAICEHDPETQLSSGGQSSFNSQRGAKLICGQMNNNLKFSLESMYAAYSRL